MKVRDKIRKRHFDQLKPRIDITQNEGVVTSAIEHDSSLPSVSIQEGVQAYDAGLGERGW